MKKLTAMELKALADSYLENDPNLSGVIIALASCRLFEHVIGNSVAEIDLLISCVENGERIHKAIDIIELLKNKDNHKADLN